MADKVLTSDQARELGKFLASFGIDEIPQELIEPVDGGVSESRRLQYEAAKKKNTPEYLKMIERNDRIEKYLTSVIGDKDTAPYDYRVRATDKSVNIYIEAMSKADIKKKIKNAETAKAPLSDEEKKTDEVKFAEWLTKKLNVYKDGSNPEVKDEGYDVSIKIPATTFDGERIESLKIKIHGVSKVFHDFKSKLYNVEKVTVEDLKMSRDRYRVKIPVGLISRIKDAVKEYEYARSWYFTVRNAALKTLNDDDYKVFLAILASTSPQKAFADNLDLTVQIFVAIQNDRLKNEDMLIRFMGINSKFFKMWADYKKANNYASDYEVMTSNKAAELNKQRLKAFLDNEVEELKQMSELEIVKVFKEYFLEAAWGNTSKMFLYFNRNGFKVSKQKVIEDMKNMIIKYDAETSSAGIGTFNEKGDMITSSKVWSFYCNLLDPEGEYGKVSFKVDDLVIDPIEPVTIDTWMIRFIFDYYGDDPEFEKIKAQVFSNTAGVYTDIASIFNKVAQRLGMRPHELQAIVWLASITKGGDSTILKTPEQAIQHNVEKVRENTDFMKRCKTLFSELNKSITNV